MQELLLNWYDIKKRDLPWRHVTDPYPIWLSEIMLQQTRVDTVLSYWTRFLALFPTIEALASADEQAVLKAWEGLGYYSRARNLKRCAVTIVTDYGGIFPNDIMKLRKLPGIGPYTAGAIASIAFGTPTPAIDGNVERVLSRVLGIREDMGIPSVRHSLFAKVQSMIPAERPGTFNQALMELGALVCQPKPQCDQCPIRSFCDADNAGDADILPIKQKKAPEKEISLGMALVFHQGRVLVYQRQERLLQGLWCYPGFEEVTSGETVEARLRELGIFAHFQKNIGQARHAFTHIIWHMELFHFEANSAHCPGAWCWAGEKELAFLPVPTAVRAATKYALQILQNPR